MESRTDRGIMATVVEKLTPERRRQLTRDALIDAAAEVFAEKGYAGASLEEIASTAGFTRGAIYSNFSGKEELLWAVLDRHVDAELDAYRDAIATDPDVGPLERAARAAGVWGDLGHKELLMLLSLELHAHALRNDDARQRLARFERDQIDKAVEFIEKEMADQGLHSTIPPEHIALIGRAAEWGLHVAASIDREHADRYREALQDVFGLLGTVMQERGAAAD